MGISYLYFRGERMDEIKKIRVTLEAIQNRNMGGNMNEKTNINDPSLLKKRFDMRGFAVAAYARAYKVDHAILSKVLQGKLDGTKDHRGGSTKKIILRLKVDGVWRGRVPWDKPPAKEDL